MQIKGQTKEQVKAGPTDAPKQGRQAAQALDISQLIPIVEVRDGLVSTTHHRALLIGVDGLDYNIMDALEKCAVVETIAHGIHDQQEYPFMWWYHSQRRSFDDLIRPLETRLAVEPNGQLRHQLILELRARKTLARTAGIVGRRSVFVLTQPHSEKESRSARTLARLGRKQDDDDLLETSGNKLWQRGAWAADLLEGLQTRAYPLSQTETMALLAGELGGVATSEDWAQAAADIQIESDYLRIGERRFRKVLYASSRPRRTNPGDLAALIGIRDIDITIACHFAPVKNDAALRQILTNQTYLRARFNSGNDDMRAINNWYSAEQGEAMLAEQRARFYMSSLYVAVEGSTLAEVERNYMRVEELMRLMRLQPHLLEWGQDLGIIATLPIAENPATGRKALPNLSGAISQEFVSQNTACWATNLVSTYEHPDGVMLGTNTSSGSIVMFNPFSINEAAHTLVLADTGAGKTTAALTEAFRWLERDPNMIYYYIDPQGSTERFTNKVGGTFVRMGAGAVINPMDRREANGHLTPLDEMTDYLSGLFALMTGLPSPDYEAALDQAIEVLYDHFEKRIPTSRQIAEAAAHVLGLYRPDMPGVLDQGQVSRLTQLVSEGWLGADETKARLREIAGEWADEYRISAALRYIYTEHRPWVGASEEERTVPILGDLIPYLLAVGCDTLARRLGPYVNIRSFGKHYNGYTNMRLDNRFISFSLLEVAKKQHPVAMYIIMKYIWGEIIREVRQRACVVDEFGSMAIDDPAVAKWVEMMYRRARYFKLRMIAIDQHLTTFLGANNRTGQVIRDQSSFYYIMRQARSDENEAALARQFHLTPGQVLSRSVAKPGNMLIVEGGSSKVTEVQVYLSPEQLDSLAPRADLGANLTYNREVSRAS